MHGDPVERILAERVPFNLTNFDAWIESRPESVNMEDRRTEEEKARDKFSNYPAQYGPWQPPGLAGYRREWK
jgi:hypothetical protein